jgi:hypothetical protein
MSAIAMSTAAMIGRRPRGRRNREKRGTRGVARTGRYRKGGFGMKRYADVMEEAAFAATLHLYQ